MHGLVTVEQILERVSEGGLCGYRYVKIGNEFRFSDYADLHSPDHKAIAKGEPVSSAGFVKVRNGKVSVGGYSMSLQLSPAANDEMELAALLNLPVAEQRESF